MSRRREDPPDEIHNRIIVGGTIFGALEGKFIAEAVIPDLAHQKLPFAPGSDYATLLGMYGAVGSIALGLVARRLARQHFNRQL